MREVKISRLEDRKIEKPLTPISKEEAKKNLEESLKASQAFRKFVDERRFKLFLEADSNLRSKNNETRTRN
jgi:hypothetical protein